MKTKRTPNVSKANKNTMQQNTITIQQQQYTTTTPDPRQSFVDRHETIIVPQHTGKNHREGIFVDRSHCNFWFPPFVFLQQV